MKAQVRDACNRLAKLYRVVAPDGFVRESHPLCSGCAASLKAVGYTVEEAR